MRGQRGRGREHWRSFFGRERIQAKPLAFSAFAGHGIPRSASRATKVQKLLGLRIKAFIRLFCQGGRLTHAPASQRKIKELLCATSAPIAKPRLSLFEKLC